MENLSILDINLDIILIYVEHSLQILVNCFSIYPISTKGTFFIIKKFFLDRDPLSDPLYL